MGLQVRLRHALGERLFDLPDRPIENPLIIGRAREADIKIPSVTVSGQHGAMFVHEGQWFLQDTSGGGATWVNGSALDGPTPLCTGDTITLGADAHPATIEVDPAGVAQGRTGEPVESSEPAPAAVSRATVAGAAPNQPARQSSSGMPASPRPPARPSAAPPSPPQPAVAAQDPWGNAGAGDDAIAGWDQPVASAPAAGNAGEPAPVRRKKPANQMSQGALFAGIGVGVAIIGGTIWAVYVEMHPAPVVVTKAPEQKYVYGKPDNNTFQEHAEGEAVNPGGGGSAPTAVAAPSPPRSAESTDTPPTPTPPPDSSTDTDANAKPDDPAWSALDALTNAPVGQRLGRYDDYRRQHPGAHATELGNLFDVAMSDLWWIRIADLCAKRDDLTKQVAAKDKEIREQPAGAFQETLKKEKMPLDTALSQAVKTLTDEMGYTSSTVPDPANQDMISKLTNERDAGKFNDWKTSTLKYILIHHGSLPWDGG